MRNEFVGIGGYVPLQGKTEPGEDVMATNNNTAKKKPTLKDYFQSAYNNYSQQPNNGNAESAYGAPRISQPISNEPAEVQSTDAQFNQGNSVPQYQFPNMGPQQVPNQIYPPGQGPIPAPQSGPLASKAPASMPPTPMPRGPQDTPEQRMNQGRNRQMFNQLMAQLRAGR